MSFAQELIDIYTQKHADIVANRDTCPNRRNNDITVFFEKEVKESAKNKMLARARLGKPTANILEYSWNERFYIDESGNVQRFTRGDIDFPSYRINDIVMKDRTFKNLLKTFESEISDTEAEAKIVITCWRPNIMTYVVEAVWGQSRYHSHDSDMSCDKNESAPRLSRSRRKTTIIRHKPMEE